MATQIMQGLVTRAPIKTVSDVKKHGFIVTLKADVKLICASSIFHLFI
jgi:hypothetical protein